jgi:hypothetical protein
MGHRMIYGKGTEDPNTGRRLEVFSPITTFVIAI